MCPWSTCHEGKGKPGGMRRVTRGLHLKVGAVRVSSCSLGTIQFKLGTAPAVQGGLPLATVTTALSVTYSWRRGAGKGQNGKRGGGQKWTGPGESP